MANLRDLRFRLPMMRGGDVRTVQRALTERRVRTVGRADGLFGPRTDGAVRTFQMRNALDVDGVVGPRTRAALLNEEPDAENALQLPLAGLIKPHRRFEGSVRWQLTARGIAIDGQPPEGTRGQPVTVRRVCDRFGPSIATWSRLFGVPFELIVATICTESGGEPACVREEPGFTGDATTPHRVSAGLMQTLISTARETLQLDHVDRAWLLEPDNSIRAGTAYIARQRAKTRFDPPVVACAYNAGGVYLNDSPANRWRMRQYPIGSSAHADRFVRWFNDCFRLFASEGAPDGSFFELIRDLPTG